MFDAKDIEIRGLREENFHLKNQIEFLKRQLCGGSGHKMVHLRSDIQKKQIPIFCRLENGNIQVRNWRDITDVYACEKCGFIEHKFRKLPRGYYRSFKAEEW